VLCDCPSYGRLVLMDDLKIIITIKNISVRITRLLLWRADVLPAVKHHTQVFQLCTLQASLQRVHAGNTKYKALEATHTTLVMRTAATQGSLKSQPVLVCRSGQPGTHPLPLRWQDIEGRLVREVQLLLVIRRPDGVQGGSTTHVQITLDLQADYRMCWVGCAHSCGFQLELERSAEGRMLRHSSSP
jgi:hypothetical protein